MLHVAKRNAVKLFRIHPVHLHEMVRDGCGHASAPALPEFDMIRHRKLAHHGVGSSRKIIRVLLRVYQTAVDLVFHGFKIRKVLHNLLPEDTLCHAPCSPFPPALSFSFSMPFT